MSTVDTPETERESERLRPSLADRVSKLIGRRLELEGVALDGLFLTAALMLIKITCEQSPALAPVAGLMRR